MAGGDKKKKKTKNGGNNEEGKALMAKRIGYEDMTLMENMTLDGVLSNLKDRYVEDLIYVCAQQHCNKTVNIANGFIFSVLDLYQFYFGCY